MARFYGTLKGQSKNRISRVGGKNSGMNSHIRTWTQGINVDLSYCEVLNNDVFHVYKTGGSNGLLNQELILTVSGNMVEIRKNLRDNKVLYITIKDDEIIENKIITLE